MSKLAEAVHAVCVAAWAGALWTVGLLVMPVLFAAHLDHEPLVAVQGRLLLLVAMLGACCGGYLLLFRLLRFGGHALRHGFFWAVLLLLLLGVGQQFLSQSLLHALDAQGLLHHWVELGLRDRSATWSGLPSVFYLVQCLVALALVRLQQGAPR